MLVKHAKKTGEWGTTPDDIRLRTTYDLADFEDEQTEIGGMKPFFQPSIADTESAMDVMMPEEAGSIIPATIAST